MTEPTTRTIAGLAPRTSSNPDLSRLQRRNRPEALQPVIEPPGELSSDSAQVAPPSTSTAVSSVPEAGAATDRITVYLDHALRLRARTAYRVTSHLEGDRTWSDFVERAILREVERREHAHNAGDTYPGSEGPLAPGRPIV